MKSMLRKKKLPMGKLLLTAFVLCCVAGLTLFCLVCWRATVPRTPADADCLIVLGAQVYMDGRMSLVLRARVDAALEAWRAGRAPAIIVCGAKGGDEPCSEAAAMADYLRDQGVPDDCVLRDEASFNTQANLANAAALMRERGWTRAIVCTSDYHLERALWIARDTGLEATGIAAPTPHTLRAFWWGRMRETISWALYFLRKL